MRGLASLVDAYPDTHTQHPHTGERCPLWTECCVCYQGLQLEHGAPLADTSWEYSSRDRTAGNGALICRQCAEELDIQPDDEFTAILKAEFLHVGAA